MSMPILSPTTVAMSTREIAALCDKAHRHVVRDLKVIADQCDINLPKFGQSYTNGCRSGFQLLWKPEVRGALYV